MDLKIEKISSWIFVCIGVFWLGVFISDKVKKKDLTPLINNLPKIITDIQTENDSAFIRLKRQVEWNTRAISNYCFQSKANE